MSPPFIGACLCGAVRYALTVEPAVTAVCHCTHCVRQSGSLFSMICGVPREAFRLTLGELAVYEDAADSGNKVLRKFCGRCGSPILSELPSRPEALYIKAGTLDEWRRFRPSIETYRSRTAEWFPAFEGVESFAERRGG